MSHDPAQVAEIARSLSSEQRRLWTLTILAVVGTEPQRRAFIAGYNGSRTPPPGASEKMREQHQLGLAVRAHLESQQ